MTGPAWIDPSLTLLITPDGPYGHSMLRRLMAAHMSGGNLIMAGIAYRIADLQRLPRDPKIMECLLSPQYITTDLTDSAKDLLWREPTANPRFAMPQGSTELYYFQDASCPTLYCRDHPQEPYKPPAYSSRRRGKKAAFRRKVKAMVTSAPTHPPAGSTHEPEAPMSFYQRIGWRELYEFILALMDLSDDDRKLFDRLVMGTPVDALAAELGMTSAALEETTHQLLRQLNVPSLTRAALLAGIADEQRP